MFHILAAEFPSLNGIAYRHVGILIGFPLVLLAAVSALAAMEYDRRRRRARGKADDEDESVPARDFWVIRFFVVVVLLMNAGVLWSALQTKSYVDRFLNMSADSIDRIDVFGDDDEVGQLPQANLAQPPLITIRSRERIDAILDAMQKSEGKVLRRIEGRGLYILEFVQREPNGNLYVTVGSYVDSKGNAKWYLGPRAYPADLSLGEFENMHLAGLLETYTEDKDVLNGPGDDRQ